MVDNADRTHAPIENATRWQRLRRAIVTPELIYGTIVSSAVIAVAADDDSDLQVFLVTLVTMIVFWAAHVFATTVANHGMRGGRVIGIREAFRGALTHSNGLIYATLVPLVFLVLGAVNVVDEDAAYNIALLVGVILLGVLGWLAFADRGSPWPIRVLGALGTALFGFIIIVFKALLH